jgi:hypothetical protein
MHTEFPFVAAVALVLAPSVVSFLVAILYPSHLKRKQLKGTRKPDRTPPSGSGSAG